MILRVNKQDIQIDEKELSMYLSKGLSVSKIANIFQVPVVNLKYHLKHIKSDLIKNYNRYADKVDEKAVREKIKLTKVKNWNEELEMTFRKLGFYK